HNTGTNTFTYYLEKPENFKYKLYDKLLNYFTKDIENPTIIDGETNKPMAANYAYNTLKIPSTVVEWCDKNFGPQLYDATESTKSLEWFANIIFENYREFGEK